MNGFSVIMALSASLGLGWTAVRMTPRLALETVDNGLAALAGALLGSRLGYVLAHWSYFQKQPLEFFQFWSGGLSGSGALMGGCLAVLLVSLLIHQHPGKVADRLLPLGAALVAGAWLACWISGAAYGRETSAWWGLPSADELGFYARRFPVQALGVLAALAWYALLESRQSLFDRLPAGSAASLWLLGTALSLFGLSFLRGDPARIVGSLRLDALGDLATILLAVLCLTSIWVARQRLMEAV